ncbi:MAG: hypothetical protein L6Q97_27900, partial [Thermoanaerobaculia bacterium]|nr:hypothetical protein [Thermoanaerobaculia bacterium]
LPSTAAHGKFYHLFMVLNVTLSAVFKNKREIFIFNYKTFYLKIFRPVQSFYICREEMVDEGLADNNYPLDEVLFPDMMIAERPQRGRM